MEVQCQGELKSQASEHADLSAICDASPVVAIVGSPVQKQCHIIIPLAACSLQAQQEQYMAAVAASGDDGDDAAVGGLSWR